MIFPVKADLVVLVKSLVDALQPFAHSHQINLSFQCQAKSIAVLYQPEEILPDIIQLISRIITFTPQNCKVSVNLDISRSRRNSVEISIQNSGVNLALLGDIRAGVKYSVSVTAEERGSTFVLIIPTELNEAPTSVTRLTYHKKTIIKPWYAEIRKRLTHHFSNPHNLTKAAKQRGSQEGIFLQKMNAIIDHHIATEGFGTTDLAQYMGLSRTQLFRKTKELTQMAPGQYIRFVRLQKAKRLLQKGEFNVSEVAYQVGFVSNSHFSRAFRRQFGKNPSAVK